jgi:pantoate--beta-alanine ligase
MYAADTSTVVEETALTVGLCGASRPGHFRGVTTIVCKLFNIVQPRVAVFGEKDAQQLRVIERMVRDLDIPVRIVRGATVREADGLAMSSRNAYLSPEARVQAICLHDALAAVRAAYAGGIHHVAALKAAAEAVIASRSLAVVDYIAIVDDATLQPVDAVAGPALVALAVVVDGTRLIDHAVLG